MSPPTVFAKPPRLQAGATVAAISLSSGLAQLFPHRYQAGKTQLSETFALRVVETPNALRDSSFLHKNPQARADDLHWALENPEVSAIVSTIGGDDSVRILPYLDEESIASHPKALLGFSDTTIAHTAFARAGVVSFYGPSLLTDLAENGGIHPFVERSLRQALFWAEPYDLHAAAEWTEEFLDWADPSLQSRRRKFAPAAGWQWWQGEGAVEGRLVGGCADVLEFLKGTRWWPDERHWEGAILALETSEEAPSPELVGYWLRNYGMQGVLGKINGLLLARPMRYDDERKARLRRIVTGVLSEFGRQDLVVVANMEFGHTSPMMTLPLGCRMRVDPLEQRISVLEAPVS